MSNKTRTLSILVGAALALAGCGSSDSDESTFTTIEASSDSEAPVTETESAENTFEVAEGMTAATIEVDGVTYSISCTAISPSNLSNPIGLGEYLGEDVAVRALAGVDANNAVAVEVAGGACTAGDAQLSDWSLAIAPGLENSLATQIACDSGLKVPNC